MGKKKRGGKRGETNIIEFIASYVRLGTTEEGKGGKEKRLALPHAFSFLSKGKGKGKKGENRPLLIVYHMCTTKGEGGEVI